MPAPEGPTIATDSPAAISKETSSKMVSGPSGLLTFLLKFSALRTVSRTMRKALAAALLFIALQNAMAADRTILVLGDSLSAAYGLRPEQGWVALLSERLKAQGYGYRVVNASVSGETTLGGLQRLPRALGQHQPAIVVLELGANDGLRGLPVRETRSNLQQMVRLSRASGARVLLVGIRIPPNYGPRYAGEFERIFPELARELDLPLVPFLLRDVALQPDLMQGDGLHPTAAAEPRVLETVWKALHPMLQSG